MKSTALVPCVTFALGVGVGTLVIPVLTGARSTPVGTTSERSASDPSARIAPAELSVVPAGTPASGPSTEPVASTTSASAVGTGDPAVAAILARIRESGGRVGVRRPARKDGKPGGIEWLDPAATGDSRPIVALTLPSTALGDLRDLGVLAELDVIRLVGAEEEIDLSSLPPLPKLDRIVFDATRVRAAGLGSLARQLHLTHVDFGDTTLDAETLGVVARLESVRSLTLDSGHVTDETLASLATATRLERLNLDDALITDAGLAHLAGMMHLKELDLTGTKITGEGFRHLAGLSALELVVLDKTRVNDEGLRHLAALLALRTVDLEATDITDAGLAHLLASHTLSDVSLEGTRITDAAFAYLGRLTTLRTLSVLNTQVTADGVERFRAAHPEVRVEQ